MARDVPAPDEAAWRDRTSEYRSAVDRACSMQDLPQVRDREREQVEGQRDKQRGAKEDSSLLLLRFLGAHARPHNHPSQESVRAMKQDMMLRPRRKPTPFAQAAANTVREQEHEDTGPRRPTPPIARSRPPHPTNTPLFNLYNTQRTAIEDLDEFIRANKREYTAPPVVVPAAGAVGGGTSSSAASAAAAATGGLSSADRDRIEAEVGAVVKTCAAQIEQLKGSVIAAQKEQQAARRRMMAAAAHHRRINPPGGVGGGPAALVNEETIAHLHGVVLALADRLGEVSAAFDKCRAARHSAAAAAAAAYGGGGGGGSGGNGLGLGLAGGALGPGRPPSARAAEAAQRYSNMAAAQAAADAWEGRNNSGGGGGASGGGGGGGGADAAQQQQQQQQQLEAESAALIASLTSRRTQAAQVERSMREVATLNQMLSTAVHHQQQQIELLYDEAVAATRNLRQGNTELRKTVRVNRSTRSYVLALLLTASALLLLFDWLA
jgi:hypothetical protein